MRPAARTPVAIGHARSMRIETERLLLRPLAIEDAAALAPLFAGDWEAISQTGRMPWPPTEAALRQWISGYVAPASHSFLMALRRDRATIGGIGFGGAGRTAELGYALGRRFWGRGYATEGVRAMLAHAAAVGYRTLEAFSFVENPASVRVLEKAGFAELGVFERDYPERGGLRKVRRFRLRVSAIRQRR
jgi:RimJ/RimL family protein N-acetyltransferase